MSLENHKAKDVIKVLTKYYKFVPVRQKGSHLLLKHADGRRVTVNVHPGKTLHPFVMGSIISQARTTKEEFLSHF